ncbi:MAG: RHS repeat-associated protein, partial [Pirellulaceae bacterium]
VFTYQLLASDTDLDRLTYDLTTAPTGAAIDAFGKITWPTSVPLIGSHDFEVKVHDPRGGEATQSFTLDVIEDTVPPKLSLIEDKGDASRNILPWQGPFKVYVRAIDNVGVASLTLSANGQDIPLDAAGTATFTFEDWTFTEINATAKAVDTNGNITTKTITFDYDFPFGWSGAGTEEIPTAVITSPADAEAVTGMVSITGTAAHDDFAAYQLSYRGVDETSFTEFLHSDTPVSNGELGVWDTSLLLNDEYVIRLEVATNGGVVNVVERGVGLAGSLKLGKFRLSFTDMIIPVAGIPIEVTRVYDTLHADRQGDFGYGWRLEYRDTDLRVGLPKSGLEDIGIYSALRPGVKIYLNVPGEDRQGFTFNPDIRVLPGFGGQNLVVARPRFTPDPGVTSTLATGTSGYLHVNELNELYAPGGIPYNPASPDFGGAYVLTTVNGLTYRIDGASGKLVTASDRNGNTLAFSDGGVFYEDKLSLAIRRNSDGLIQSITDPLGNKVAYEYAGRQLSEVVDRAGNRSSFTYSGDSVGRLTDYDAGLGTQPARYEYDSTGRVVAFINPDGIRSEVGFDVGAQTQTVRDGLGRVTVSQYDNQGNVTLQISPEGRSLRMEYDAFGNVTMSIDQFGNRTETVYNRQGFPTRQINALGHASINTYENGSELVSSVDPLGRTIRRQFDDSGNVIRVESFDGLATVLTYNGNGNLLTRLLPNGGLTTYEYDSLGRPIKEIDANGDLRERTFDANGRLVSDTIQQTIATGQIENRKVLFDRDANDRVIEVVDAFGNSIESNYDAFGRLVSKTNELGHNTAYSYDAAGNLTSVEKPGDSGVTRKFDAAGQLIQTTTAVGHSTRYVYDLDGNRLRRILPDQTPDNPDDNPRELTEFSDNRLATASVDANGNRTEFEYDSIGRLILQRDALGNETVFKYDAVDRLVATIDPLGRKTQTLHDDARKAVTTILPNGTAVRQEHDFAGNVIRSVDPLDRENRFVYDSVGNLLRVIESDGRSTSYQYDEFGNRIAAIDAAGRTTSFEYDAQSRLTAKVLPLGQREEFTYDAAGNKETHRDFNGVVTEFEYDANQRLLAKNSGGDTVKFTYLTDGQIESTEDARGVTFFDYDELGRLIRRLEPDGREIRYSFDAVGNLLSLTTPGGTTQYTYNPLNQLVQLEQDTESIEYSYDDVGNLLDTTHGNGLVQSRVYNEMNWIVSDTLADTSGTIEQSTHEFDLTGRLAETLRLDGSQVSYRYDINYRLAEETRIDPQSNSTTISYTFDEVGNRLQREHSILGMTEYTYDANDQLLTESSPAQFITYSYDANGKLLTETTDGDQSANYQYNPRGELTSSATNIGTPEEVATDYQYDAVGTRVAKITNGLEVRYLVSNASDYPEVVMESRADGSVLATHAHGQNIALTTSASGTFHYHADLFGSTRAISDSTGNVMETFEYDAFGSLVGTNLETEFNHLYKGEFRDFETGFDYLRARYADFASGRFIGRDPFSGFPEVPQTQHPYQYVRADAVNLTDPSGEVSLTKLLVGIVISGTILIPLSQVAGVVINAIADAKTPNLRNAINEVIKAASEVETVYEVIDDNPRQLHYRRQAGLIWDYRRLGELATQVTVGTFPGAAGGAGYHGGNIITEIDTGIIFTDLNAGPFFGGLSLPRAAGFVAETLRRSAKIVKVAADGSSTTTLSELTDFLLPQDAKFSHMSKRICRIVASNSGHKKDDCS